MLSRALVGTPVDPGGALLVCLVAHGRAHVGVDGQRDPARAADALGDAAQELALLAHPATEAKVVTREGVDQHLDAQRHLLDWPHLKEYLLQALLLVHLGKLLGWNRIRETCLYTLEPSLLSSFVPSNKKFQIILNILAVAFTGQWVKAEISKTVFILIRIH